MAKSPDCAVIRDAVMLACRAPSLHNSQPWRWVAEGATLQLWADLCRAMTATDHTGRELTLSCGAALDHLRVAMAAGRLGERYRAVPQSGRTGSSCDLAVQAHRGRHGGAPAPGGCDPSPPHRPAAVWSANCMAGFAVGAAARRGPA